MYTGTPRAMTKNVYSIISSQTGNNPRAFCMYKYKNEYFMIYINTIENTLRTDRLINMVNKKLQWWIKKFIEENYYMISII